MPAKPAAIMNGNSGRQQLDAARTLPIAAKLTAMVLAPLDDADRGALADMLVPLVIPQPPREHNLLHQSRFHERPMIDRFEAIFHPQMRGQLICGDNPSMRDLETWLPWQ